MHEACPGKSVLRRTDCSAMTIAVDLGRKATKQTKLSAFISACILTLYLLYPLFSLEKMGILILCQSRSVECPSICPSVTFLVNVSPKPL